MNEQELARLIATLEHLKHPFDRKQISKLPKTDKRPALDYVNHAHVTNRLNQYAPDCSWVIDEMFTQNGECWIRGTMTIYGASRVEFGKGKNPLEAMSHFIRRAAMRFGVATDLWAKEDFEDTDEAPGLADALPSPGAERPGSTESGAQAYGEGASALPQSGSGERGGGVESNVVADSPASTPSELVTEEPHEHVAGSKKLASGKALCIFERSDGSVCGKPFTPKPTIHTAPVEEVEVRKDLVG